MVHEALLKHLEDGAWFLVGRRLLHDGLVDVGVKGFAVRVNAGNPVALEHFQELALHHGHALDERAVFAGLPGRGEGPFEVVEDGQQVERERRVPVAALLLSVLLVPLLIVLELGAVRSARSRN